MLDGVFAKNDIIGTAMKAISVRNDVITNNIANAETPGFKKSVVVFEDALRDVVDRYKETDNLNLSEAGPVIQVQHNALKYRLDGNNVDIDTEMVALYTNSVKYDMIAGFAGYKSLESVLSRIK